MTEIRPWLLLLTLMTCSQQPPADKAPYQKDMGEQRESIADRPSLGPVQTPMNAGISAKLAVTRVRWVPDSMRLTTGEIAGATCQPLNKWGTILKNNCAFRSLDTTIAKITVVDGQHVNVRAMALGRTGIRAVSNNKADTLWVRITTTAATDIQGLIVKPDSQHISQADWEAVGVYFMDSLGGLYGKDTVKLSWTCPQGGPTKCPTKQVCLILRFSDGKIALAGQYKTLPICTAEMAKFPDSLKTVNAAQQAVADSAKTIAS